MNPPICKECRDKTGASTNKSSLTLYFTEIVKVTQPDHIDAGAILFKLADIGRPLDDEPVWIPKKLCSNLEYEPSPYPDNVGSVEVWSVFIRENMPELYAALMEVEDEKIP